MEVWCLVGIGAEDWHGRQRGFERWMASVERKSVELLESSSSQSEHE